MPYMGCSFSHPTQLFAAITTRNFLIAFPFFILFTFLCIFTAIWNSFFPRKIRFHAGINKFRAATQKYVTKKGKKKHTKRLKMSLKRISRLQFLFLQIFRTINFCTFRTFFQWNCEEKNTKLSLQLPHTEAKRGGSGGGEGRAIKWRHVL